MNTSGIVVGVDNSVPSAAALRWAAEEARLRHASLRVVYTWELTCAEEYTAGVQLREVSAVDARARATSWVADALGESPRPTWTLDIIEGPPGPALVARSREAELLVVGTREHVGVRRFVAGSVSHYCVSHASCPVVAVPAEGPPAPASVPAAQADPILVSQGDRSAVPS